MYRVILLMMLFFISCDKDFKAPEPEQLIEQNVMEDILYDIKLLKAAKSKNYRILKDNNVQVDAYIYDKYKLDSITLRENIAYYATASFKISKEMEVNIKQRFEADKKIVTSKIKNDKGEKEINDNNELLIGDFESSSSLLLSDNYMKWRAVNSSVINLNEGIDENQLLKLVANNKVGQHRIDIPVKKLDGKYKFSILAKKNELHFIRLRIGSQGYSALFDLNGGKVICEKTDKFCHIIKEEDGWYKCTVTCAVKNVSLIRVNVFRSATFSDYSGDNLESVYLRNPKLKEIKL